MKNDEYHYKELPCLINEILFHYAPIRNIHCAINTIRTLINILQIGLKALCAVSKYSYSMFDGLVGDNLCQIRAVFLHEFFKSHIKGGVTEEISLVDEAMNSLLAFLVKFYNDLHKMKSGQIKNIVSTNRNLNLGDFFINNDMNFFSRKDLMAVILLYFLSKYTMCSAEGVHIGINYKILCNDLRCSKNMARNIVRKYQRYLSSYSTYYVLSMCLDREAYSSTQKMIKVDDEGRAVLPCYIATRMLLHNLISSNMPIILNVSSRSSVNSASQLTLIFSENKSIYNIRDAAMITCSNDDPCIVFSAVTEYPSDDIDCLEEYLVSKLNLYGVENVIHANMAKHPQFPGKHLSAFKDNPFGDIINGKKDEYTARLESEMLRMKKLSVAWGCCKENPTFLLINHIYCDKLSNFTGSGKSVIDLKAQPITGESHV